MSTPQSNYEYYLNTDVSNYIGEWIAISDNAIIAHGHDVKQVADEAKKISGSKRFLLCRIPSQETFAVLSNEETMRQIESSETDIKQGRVRVITSASDI